MYRSIAIVYDSFCECTKHNSLKELYTIAYLGSTFNDSIADIVLIAAFLDSFAMRKCLSVNSIMHWLYVRNSGKTMPQAELELRTIIVPATTARQSLTCGITDVLSMSDKKVIKHFAARRSATQTSHSLAHFPCLCATIWKCRVKEGENYRRWTMLYRLYLTNVNTEQELTGRENWHW